jgi:uncharacterized protein
MARIPRDDREVPAFWSSLGLPGLVDVHTHFMPPRLLDAVWQYFDRAGPLVGRPWPILYRESESERVTLLRGLGVRWFTALCYPHKPGMAAPLNAWVSDFCDRTPDCVPSATFFPEPDAARYVEEAVIGGARVFKAHVQVGGYDPRDPLLDDVWALLSEAQVPVIAHVGSGPVARPAMTGPGPISAVLARHPRLVLVVAHLGAPEYAEFLDLAVRHPHVHLDTTMAFTAFFEALAPFPPDLRPRLTDLGDRIVLGSDFPNIPYAYADQLTALSRLELGDTWLRAVCWDNGARLLGIDGRRERR